QHADAMADDGELAFRREGGAGVLAAPALGSAPVALRGGRGCGGVPGAVEGAAARIQPRDGAAVAGPLAGFAPDLARARVPGVVPGAGRLAKNAAPDTLAVITGPHLHAGLDRLAGVVLEGEAPTRDFGDRPRGIGESLGPARRGGRSEHGG